MLASPVLAYDLLFDARMDFAVGYFPVSVSAADLDGDGDGDLAVANRNSNNVSILLNNGNGTFALAVNYDTGDGPSSVFFVDVDGGSPLDWIRVGGQTGTPEEKDYPGDPVCRAQLSTFRRRT